MTDSASARTAILGAIRAALRDEPVHELPALAPIFDAQPPLAPLQLAEMFRSELSALQGETIFVPSASDVPSALAGLLAQRQFKSAAVQNSARVSAALAQISGDRFFLAAGASASHIAAADCGIIEATALLADTGSVIALFHNRGERLLPFLPRTCIVLADVSQLHRHMDDDAVRALYAQARAGARGEGVIITGPSRSADIEKVLVLGAHGPQALLVLIAGVPTSA